ncbi:MAG: hypothetical protein M0Q92_10330 [Methanoregula sp.]|jgi:hypothetical protein|nr:hypothetical protein [Methanoregula sp.]
MELSPEGIIAYVTGYIEAMPSAIMQGDIFALTITLIAFFIAVVVINRLTGLLIVFLKKAILFIIVTLAFWQFILMFSARLSAEGLTNDTLIFGAAGFVIGFVAISTSLVIALHSYIDAKKGRAPPVPENPYEKMPSPNVTASVPVSNKTIPSPGITAAPYHEDTLDFVPAADADSSRPINAVTVTSPSPEPAQAGITAGMTGGTLSVMKDALSVTSLKNDQSLGAVIAYLVIAQFGVFSSMTIPAPSFQVGVAFFALFIIAGLFFIHFTYRDYRTGLRHLVSAILVGAIIAIVLGHFWGNIPLDQLISPAFFESSALVALVTGLALSLFMGGKG